LSVYDVRRPFWIYGTSATGTTLVGDFIGTDPTGTFANPSEQLYAFGINIEQGAPNSVIGTPARADRNVISGNARQAIGIWHRFTDNGIVQNNIIGLSPDGTRDVPNWRHGVDLNFGSQHWLIGGTNPFEHNVISGNLFAGVQISHQTNTAFNRVI